MAFSDEIRPGVKEAIATCEAAGITVKMVTGDHAGTARAIGREVGIVEESDEIGSANITPAIETTASEEDERLLKQRIYYRMTPQQKLSLVLAHQRLGKKVLVTGDGYNDGPALAAAHVGVAMGKGGTDMARQTAGIVLLDDDFRNIVATIREGRKMLNNLVKSTRFYLACKLALFLLFFIPLIFQSKTPLAPLQIIILEIFMDLGASSAFTMETTDVDVLATPPRRGHLFGWSFIWIVCTRGALMLGLCFFIFFMSKDRVDQDVCHTLIFYGWLLGHVLLANSMRSIEQPILGAKKKNRCIPQGKGCCTNVLMVIWTAAAFIFVLLLVTIQGFSQVLQLVSFENPQLAQPLGYVGEAVGVMFFVHEFWKYIKYPYYAAKEHEASA
jgi:Ca2+-transporting ATPase